MESNKLHPTFGILYPLGRGEDTIPSYENQPIGKTIAEHIHAVGGSISQKQSPDIMLAVNTPLLSTGESGQFSNFGMMKQSTTDFITQIKSTIDRGISLSIVDVYFANGSDNTLMNLIVKIIYCIKYLPITVGIQQAILSDTQLHRLFSPHI